MNANFPGFRKGVMPGHALVGVKLTAITVRLLPSFLPLSSFGEKNLLLNFHSSFFSYVL